ncbi:MAG: ABC transporter ATP-binding protein [Bacteroidota bacterium]
MAIEVQNIFKSFGPNEVLKGLSFTFEPGKINMIIGASGSGKSVMLKCIVGLMTPDSGEVIFDGINFHEAEFKDVKEIRQNIGMLFQGSALFDYMNVEENVAFPIKMFTRQKSSEIKDRVNFCLERVNLEGNNKLYPSELSGGMQKRVGIARAIAMNPKFLFVDEPNSGLDPLTASVIDKLIQELTLEFNMTTVVVSHDMNSVMNIGDKIMFLYKGRKEWEGTNKEILHSDSDALNEFVFVSDLIKK